MYDTLILCDVMCDKKAKSIPAVLLHDTIFERFFQNLRKEKAVKPENFMVVCAKQPVLYNVMKKS